MPKSSKAFVVSVSIGVGCYRHIMIAADATLEVLSSVILDAFGFDDDHAHAFFMDNREWSDKDSYYDERVDEDEKERHTCDFTLEDAGMRVDKRFVYVFDFGDNWSFQCRVLKEAQEEAVVPQVIRTKGEPPPQYG